MDEVDESMDMEDIKETEEDDPGQTSVEQTRKVYLPGHKIKNGEVLEYDPAAYVMLHEASAGTPCLSFDIIPDNLGQNREDFPHSCYVVAGTQAPKRGQNGVIVMKLSNLQKTYKEHNEDDESSDSSSEDESDADGVSLKSPIMNSSVINHYGGINRIRCCVRNDTVVAAAWSETGRVSLWDLQKHLQAVESRSAVRIRNDKRRKPPKAAEKETALFTFSGHADEGFAMDWSPSVPGVLATGDCRSNIHVWSPRENEWNVDLRPLKSHTGSVEDLQWSPSESNVLGSCSVDKSIKIWDIRVSPSKACMMTLENAHSMDVNVMSWNRQEPLIVSGGDDGYLKVWDLRQFKTDSAVAIFKHHTEPITTVEWHPSDSSMFASGGADNQIALWDLAMERADEFDAEEIKEIPPQLLFIHLGQESVKEVHWHRQIPGMVISTAETGFNIFKTVNI